MTTPHPAPTMGDILLNSAALHPDETAVAVPEEAWTYTELESRARAVAAGLASRGVEPGEHVGLLLPNGLDFVAAWFGTALAGAVVVPINVRYRPDELHYVISHSDITTVLTTDANADHVDLPQLLTKAFPSITDPSGPGRLQLDAAPHLRQIVNLGERPAEWQMDRGTFLQGPAQQARADIAARRSGITSDDPAALVYTSGTTARPKACVHSQRAIAHNWLAAKDRLELNATDVVWDPLPLFHGTAFGILLATIAAGGTFLTQPYVDADVALDLIERHAATFLYPGFPAVTTQLIEHPRFALTDLSRVRAVLAISPPDLWASTQAAFGSAVQLSAYGLQEAGGVLSYTQLDDTEDGRKNTCGPPFPQVEIRIVDPATGNEAPPESYGEILVRGPGSFSGYHKDPEATQEVLDNEGFIHTGDLGALDETGRIMYRGRIKNMLKVGGENVAPAEIESVLLTHPAVTAVAVVGIPDGRLEEIPAAFVELREENSATAEDLIAYCAERLARFKVPRLVRFVQEWPMSATKIQTSKLREQLLAEMAETETTR